jgi:RNA-directed DNA polymerase
MVVKSELEPHLEPYFDVDSYGYRPGRSAHDAIRVTALRSSRSDYILEFDIKGLFDNIRHDLLLKAVTQHTDNKWVILYVKRWLKAPMLLPSGEIQERNMGTPQGGVISPLLANLFMHYTFDLWMRRTFPKLPFCRYADDGLVHCYSYKQAQLVKQELGRRLEQCGLSLHPIKTKIVYCGLDKKKMDEPTKLEFLGFDFKLRKCRIDGAWTTAFYPGISLNSMKHCRETIKSWKLEAYTNKELEDLAHMINPIIKGWINYYGMFYKTCLKSVFSYLNVSLVKWAIAKYKNIKSKSQGTHWLAKARETRPNLFANWTEGFTAWHF